MFIAFLLSHGLWTKHSLWGEGLYQSLWGVRQERMACLENSCQTKKARIIQRLSQLSSRLSRALSWHRQELMRHNLVTIWNLLPAPKSHNSAYWLQCFTVSFLHRPQCKVKRTAALNAQTKVGVQRRRCQKSRYTVSAWLYMSLNYRAKVWVLTLLGNKYIF